MPKQLLPLAKPPPTLYIHIIQPPTTPMHQHPSTMGFPSRQDENLVEQFTKLKNCLSEDNYVNISNLQRLNSNFNTLFSIVKDGFSCMRAKIERDRLTLAELHRLLALHHIPFTPHESDYEADRRMEAINQKILDFMTQKTAVASSTKRKKRAQKTDRLFELGDTADWAKTTHAKPRHSEPRHSEPPMPRESQKVEYHQAIRYVQEELRDKLELDPQGLNELPKHSILNLYVRWRSESDQSFTYDRLSISMIQMALTNEVKRLFPSLTHNQKCFKGLRFRPAYQQFSHLTDLRYQKMHEDPLSQLDEPPLPDFDHDL